MPEEIVTTQTDAVKELSDMKTANAALLARLEKLETAGKPPAEDEDLQTKARKTIESDDKKKSDNKALENALKFSMNSAEFLKQNQSLLPKDISEIFKAAEKENFESAIEKDSAIKSGILQSFFSVQSNLDLLTPGLKSNLEEYLKLTKTGKQEKALSVYDTIFEPAFEMLRRVKRAEALNKGFGSSGGSEDAYKSKMVELSKKHYLGDKA